MDSASSALPISINNLHPTKTAQETPQASFLQLQLDPSQTEQVKNHTNSTSFFACIGHPESDPCGRILFKAALVCSLTVLLMYPVYYLVSNWRRHHWMQSGMDGIAALAAWIAKGARRWVRAMRDSLPSSRVENIQDPADVSREAVNDLEKQKQQRPEMETVDVDRTMRPTWMGGTRNSAPSQKRLGKESTAVGKRGMPQAKENISRATASDEAQGNSQREAWISGDILSVLRAKIVYGDVPRTKEEHKNGAR